MQSTEIQRTEIQRTEIQPAAQPTVSRPEVRHRCHHKFRDDRRCGSPSLRGERYCYYHHPDRAPVRNTYERRGRRGFHLPMPVDRASLHYALSQVVTRLADNRLDPHRAGLLLYSLQIVGLNLPNDGWS